jgi:Saxitoxin biosynthesis operon protein SxtJ
MSSANDNPFKPSDRMLRQFSGLWILFFGAIAAWQGLHQHRHSTAIILAVVAVVGGVLGLAWPRGIKPIFIGWMALAFPIGWVISRLILGILFYGLFTPVAWIFRLMGRDAMALKPQPQAATYWLPKEHDVDKARYFNQF